MNALTVFTYEVADSAIFKGYRPLSINKKLNSGGTHNAKSAAFATRWLMASGRDPYARGGSPMWNGVISCTYWSHSGVVGTEPG